MTDIRLNVSFLVLDYGSARTIINVTNGLLDKTIGHPLDYNCSHTDHITQCEKCQNLNADTSEFDILCHSEYFYLLPSSPIYPVNLQHSMCKHVFSIRVENNMDLADLQCFQKKKSKTGVLRTRVKCILLITVVQSNFQSFNFMKTLQYP